MLGLGEITKEGLKMIGFKRLGMKTWRYYQENNFTTITVDLEFKPPHVSLECLNDSMHVPNAKNLSDIIALQTLFKD